MQPDQTKLPSRVLVVDDNISIHDDFRKIFTQSQRNHGDLDQIEAALFGSQNRPSLSQHIQVDFATQGQEAYEMANRAKKQGHTYSVAFVDGRMPPGWDGIETIHQLWKVIPDLQIILCTAYADYSWEEIQHVLGETDSLVILKKPFDNIEVKQLVHALTRKWELTQHIEGKLHRLAYFDNLTGLPNRACLIDHLHEKLESGSHGALLFIDLDNFKRINDTLGHNAGDELLKIIARRLAGCIRESESYRQGERDSKNISARLGGDEFAVVIDSYTAIEDIAGIAKRIIRKISRPITLDQHQVLVTPSIGIALFPDNGHHINEILKNADLAMYVSKRNGANNFHFYQHAMNADAMHRLIMETHLRQALDNNEFYLEYQPQVDLQSGKLSGFEALLRWKNHELGQVPPSQFITVAEESALIIPLGEWIIEKACLQAMQWIDSGFSLGRIGVNVSPCQFMQPNFVKKIEKTLQETRLPASFLQIEITESLLSLDTSDIANSLQTLHDFGIQIAIDDFGTGYSNLSRLKELPIDQLKIDRSFVCGIDDNEKNQSILNAIITIASSINLNVIAEGVETEKQWQFLKYRHCHEAQGFFISHPMKKDRATAFLQNAQKTARNQQGKTAKI